MKPILTAILTLALSSTTLADTLVVVPLSTGGHVAIRIKSAGGVELVGVFDAVTVVAPDPIVPPSPQSKVTAVVYVYEKDSNAVPLQVAKSLQDINAAGGVVASDFEEDTVDGDGQVPEQYKVALDAARKAGLPALVTLKGQTVHKVVKAPKTTAQVMEAMQ